MEEKYWELREAVDRAWDRHCKAPTEITLLRYGTAYQRYMEFCSEVLEKLMEENSDILKRLKEC